MHIPITQIQSKRDLVQALSDPRPLELGERGVDALLELLPILLRADGRHDESVRADRSRTVDISLHPP